MQISIKDGRGSGQVSLYYEEHGPKDGTALVLLHGNGEDGSIFSHQLDYFSGEYRIIIPDTRGHGKSERGKAPFTIKQFAKDLYWFLKGLELDKVFLLGFSDGGNTGLMFAMNHQEMLAGLIANGANLDPAGVKLRYQSGTVLEYGMVSMLARLKEEAVPKKEMLGLMVTQPHITQQDLASIRIPVLVLAGTRDMIKESHTRSIARGLPNSRLALVEGGHWIANRNPDRYNHEVGKFLKECRISLQSVF